MTNKHTPGPWYLRTPYHIRLLAAAPETAAERDRLKEINADLLAALERTLSWLTSYPGGGTMGTSGPYEQARAAIAKATGQAMQDLADIGQEINI